MIRLIIWQLPFVLPADIKMGDYIAIEGVGAYGTTTATKFNGFSSETLVEIKE